MYQVAQNWYCTGRTYSERLEYKTCDNWHKNWHKIIVAIKLHIVSP
jgi:hypothetical protein